MIRHTVVYTLKHPPGSGEESDFLAAIARLEAIPTVRRFERLRQVSKKNSFAFGLSMEFETQDDYETYNRHPDHVAFVNTRWIPEVADFMEIDYIPLTDD